MLAILNDGCETAKCCPHPSRLKWRQVNQARYCTYVAGIPISFEAYSLVKGFWPPWEPRAKDPGVGGHGPCGMLEVNMRLSSHKVLLEWKAFGPRHTYIHAHISLYIHTYVRTKIDR